MNFSLGEVEAMARKAVRGAGYEWGIADEAGWAVRWLEARGQGGIASLAALLADMAGQDLPTFTPTSLDNWSSESGTLCPLLAGIALADAASLLGDRPLELASVKCPVLLFPFVAHVARIKAHPIQLEARDARADISSDDLDVSGAWDITATITLSVGTASPAETPRHTRATPSQSDWRILNRYASRTYAPATEASRLKGAGAGLTDND